MVLLKLSKHHESIGFTASNDDTYPVTSVPSSGSVLVLLSRFIPSGSIFTCISIVTTGRDLQLHKQNNSYPRMVTIELSNQKTILLGEIKASFCDIL